MRCHALRAIDLLCIASIAVSAGCHRGDAADAGRPVPGGVAARGGQFIEAYGCGSCHIIPGVRNASGMVGPSLEHFAKRSFVAGEVPNTAEYLQRWIEAPQAIEPKTAMPALGVQPGEARDIAAYLYTLR